MTSVTLVAVIAPVVRAIVLVVGTESDTAVQHESGRRSRSNEG
jgi:hypothetical protein